MNITGIRSTAARRAAIVLILPWAILVYALHGMVVGWEDMVRDMIDAWVGGERFPDDLTAPD